MSKGGGNKLNLNLKFRRIERGYSQKELASMVGVTNQTISNYERNKIRPSYENMKKISKILDSSVDELFYSGEWEA